MIIKDTRMMFIRRFNASDMGVVLKLISQIESTDDLVQSARTQFMRELEDPHDEEARFVAVEGDLVIGTMGCGPGSIPSKHALWADWLVVDQSYRRYGIASLLYDEIEAFALSLDKKYLCLDIGNIDKERAAYRFHLRNGFQIVGQIPDYWGKSEHLNIMAKYLI
ncbi:GNAT family N-acetyltransferase [Xenorhabdus bovienii]|uniref:GNAT family N-acetyltransferase n=1 Tax=Xenorhabdus bovienii TaxID=40576 RepID=UPI0023B2263E|nr:GNAT family N-acetyltransferase [Xenorhabdus bovienii]MDE9544457.1 GNAT family N-acetyltransferase [Xenorhabdus bovienii]MDE9566037.1 GNAT family N-acetyltransferase [Xenorhabdus bovienii]